LIECHSLMKKQQQLLYTKYKINFFIISFQFFVVTT